METITLTKEEIIRVFFNWDNSYISQPKDYQMPIEGTTDYAEQQADNFIKVLNQVRLDD